MLATGILTQHNRYSASLFTLWHRLIVLVARFQKNVKTQRIMVVQPYTSIIENILLNIRNTILSRNRHTKPAIDTNGSPKHLHSVSVFHTSFALFTSSKQFIHPKWPLNILYHVSRSYLVILTQIKHWLFFYSVNCDRHISPRKKKQRAWSERLRLILRSLLKLECFGYNNNNGDFVNQQCLRNASHLNYYWS